MERKGRQRKRGIDKKHINVIKTTVSFFIKTIGEVKTLNLINNMKGPYKREYKKQLRKLIIYSRPIIKRTK